MTREQLEAIVLTSPSLKGRNRQHERLNGMEDYLFIGGDRLNYRAAAERLGVSHRTIWRWRKVLREAP